MRKRLFYRTKTIYIKETDLPLLKKVQEGPGESISALFAEFLRTRITGRTPEENKIIEFIKMSARKRDAVSRERQLPDFLASEYAEAERYAARSLNSMRAGETREARAFSWAASTYYELAERDVKETRALTAKIAELLGGKPRARSRK